MLWNAACFLHRLCRDNVRGELVPEETRLSSWGRGVEFRRCGPEKLSLKGLNALTWGETGEFRHCRADRTELTTYCMWFFSEGLKETRDGSRGEEEANNKSDCGQEQKNAGSRRWFYRRKPSGMIGSRRKVVGEEPMRGVKRPGRGRQEARGVEVRGGN